MVLTVHTAGCGLLLYPERQGQKSGSIDPGVAILDAAGLVVFIVPGLIAFGVDFITGCIYLPGGTRASVDGDGLQTVYMDPAALDKPGIEDAVEQATGSQFALDSPTVVAFPVADAGTLKAAVAAAL